MAPKDFPSLRAERGRLVAHQSDPKEHHPSTASAFHSLKTSSVFSSTHTPSVAIAAQAAEHHKTLNPHPVKSSKRKSSTPYRALKADDMTPGYILKMDFGVKNSNNPTHLIRAVYLGKQATNALSSASSRSLSLNAPKARTVHPSLKITLRASEEQSQAKSKTSKKRSASDVESEDASSSGNDASRKSARVTRQSSQRKAP